MSRFFRTCTTCLAGLFIVGTAMPLRASPAAVVISIKSIDELLNDLTLLSEIQRHAGQETKTLLEAVINNFTEGAGLAGIDREKPLVAYVNITNSGNPMPFVLIPVSDVIEFKKLLSKVTSLFDSKGDIWTLAFKSMPATFLFARIANDYCYISMSSIFFFDGENFEPEQLLIPGELVNDDYDIAIDIYLAEIPQRMKLAASLNTTLPAADDTNDAKRERFIVESAADFLKSIANEGQRVTFGFDISSESRTFTFDAKLAAKPSSRLAKVIARFGKTVPKYASIIPEPSPLSMVLSFPTGEAAEFLIAILDSMEKGKTKSMEESTDFKTADDRELMKKLDKHIFQVLRATIDGEDFHAAMFVEKCENGELRMVSGIKVAKGDDVEKIVEHIVSEGNAEINDRLKLDAEMQEGMRIHSIKPEFDVEARNRAGNDLLYLAIRTDSVWASIGEDSLAAMKANIAQSNKQSEGRKKNKKSESPISFSMKPATILAMFAHNKELVHDEATKAMIDRAKVFTRQDADELTFEIGVKDEDELQIHFECSLDLLKLFGPVESTVPR